MKQGTFPPLFPSFLSLFPAVVVRLNPVFIGTRSSRSHIIEESRTRSLALLLVAHLVASCARNSRNITPRIIILVTFAHRLRFAVVSRPLSRVVRRRRAAKSYQSRWNAAHEHVNTRVHISRDAHMYFRKSGRAREAPNYSYLLGPRVAASRITSDVCENDVCRGGQLIATIGGAPRGWLL